MSSLGQLPEFGSGRGLSGASLNHSSTGGGFHDLDNALESLLEDNSEKRGGGRQKAKTRGKDSTPKPLRSGGDEFYSQMAALANEDFDYQEEDEPLTAADSKKLADSLDLDDMDANLFGSFSQSQSHKRRRSSSKKSNLSSSKPGPEGSTKQREAVTAEPKLRVADSGKEDKMVSTLKNPEKTSEATSILKASQKSKPIKTLKDFDDLLDLLSDSEDEDLVPKTREKPKIQLTLKSKPEASTTSTPPTPTPTTLGNSEDPVTQGNGKPITSIDKNTISEKNDEFERPSTSRGKKGLAESATSSVSGTTVESKKSSSGADILTLDSSLKQSTPAGSLKSAQVEFDDDDDGDDLLSGMGLDDSDVTSGAKQPGKGTPERRGSTLDDILGKKSTASSNLEAKEDNKMPSTKAKKLREDDGTMDDNDEEDGFQFGGYTPSAANGSSPLTSSQAKKPRLKVPQGRRGLSKPTLPQDALTARPGSAPSPVVKKSVRFSDTVETSDRPLSSPATTTATTSEGGGVANPISGSHGNQRTSASFDKEETSNVSKRSSEGAKKPPLPKRSSAISGKSKDDELVETDTKVEDKLGQDIDDGAKVGEGEAPVQGKGRRTSHTKPPPSTTHSLFEETPQTTDIGLSSDDGPLMQEGVTNSFKSEGGKMERPVFPWQKGRQARSQSLGSANAPGSPSRHLSEKRSAGDHMTSHDPPNGPKSADHVTTASHEPLKGPTTGDHMTSSHDPIVDQSSQLASFQEILLQQQKQMHEQFKESLQAQLGGGVKTTGSSKLSSVEDEKLRGELQRSQELVKELERQLEEAKSKHSETQKKVDEVEQQLQCVESERKKLEAEAREQSEKMNELESSLQKTQVELSTQLEDTKMKLHRVELERTQLQYSLESANSRHNEEVDALQKSHDSRVKAMEESFQRRETRWREEAESEALRHQEKLQQVEREKMDAVLALKKKIDALEVNKTNEISRLQDIHWTSIDDLKREHEQDKHHLLSMHRQEMDALKAAHSHTRMLSELTHQVESSTREVSQLQAKLEQAHSMRVEEQAQRTRIHQEQLKTLEERLVRQQAENSAERERLHLLIAKLESHTAQQSKSIDQEKWQLQQDTSRLKTQQTAFEEERASFLRKMEEDREQLQQAREKFLLEQREVLGKCYEERRRLATERAQLEVIKKRAKEREETDSQKSLQIEAELEASRSHMEKERDRIGSEMSQLRQDQIRVRAESEAIAKERERLEKLAKEVEERSQEAENLHQSALAMKEKGEQSLHEAQCLRDHWESRSKSVEHRMSELKEEEKKAALEQLSLARQRRDLQEHQLTTARDLPLETNDDTIDAGQSSCTSPVLPPNFDSVALPPPPPTANSNCTHDTTTSTTLPPISQHHHASLTSLDTHPLLSSSAPVQIANHGRRQQHRGGGLGAKLHASHRLNYSSTASSRRYSPASSPAHSQQLPLVMSMLGPGHQSAQSDLKQIEYIRNLRQLALLVEQDYEDLEEEAKFLESLQRNGGQELTIKN